MHRCAMLQQPTILVNPHKHEKVASSVVHNKVGILELAVSVGRMCFDLGNGRAAKWFGVEAGKGGTQRLSREQFPLDDGFDPKK